MNNFDLYNKVNQKVSKTVTTNYSTSFSLGIKLLSRKMHKPIYSIYGFVRFADEIVDTFHQYPQGDLLKEFKEDTYKAIDRKISLNPVLHSFQKVVNEYGIEHELIEAFLNSMEMDLSDVDYDREKFEKYILGSAEVVGLMCLRVFTDGNDENYINLKSHAMKLGAAFQKVNFLRDLNFDAEHLGRIYFPDVDLKNLDDKGKYKLIAEIKEDFDEALTGIKKLDSDSRLGVYIAFLYYKKLLNKIERTSVDSLLNKRMRIPNFVKFTTIFSAYFRNRLNLI